MRLNKDYLLVQTSIACMRGAITPSNWIVINSDSTSNAHLYYTESSHIITEMSNITVRIRYQWRPLFRKSCQWNSLRLIRQMESNCVVIMFKIIFKCNKI
jgi:hypothetical protein